MAKGNLVLGTGRGSIGDVTLYRRNGQQVSRVRNRVVKNPKTDAQMIQRVIIATVAKAYSAMKSICDHSFQGFSYGAQNMARFESINANLLRNQLAMGELSDVPPYFSEKGAVGAVPNEWIISDGTLTPIEVTPKEGMDSESVSAFELVDLTSVTGGATYQNVADTLGVEIGDQLTLCVLFGNGSSTKFVYGRLILSSNDGDQTQSVVDDEYSNARNVNIGSAFSDSKLYISIANVPNGYHPIAFGLIVSRKDGSGAWLRSKCQMTPLTIDMSGMGAPMNDALASYNNEDLEGVYSPYYLNNANNAGGASEEDPSNP